MKLDRTSQAYQRATAAGFTFGEVSVQRVKHDYANETATFIEASFTCVCGRTERVRQVFSARDLAAVNHPYIRDGAVDVALILERHGSFSRKHLQEDGYTPEEIDRIREPWEARERRQREHLRYEGYITR